MRTDVYVENDSGAWSLLSSSVVERVIDDGRDDDGQFVRSQEVVLASLVGDDSFVARVVVGEPLSRDEKDQWIAHFRSALEVPCGKLLVAGGFDPDVLGDWVENGQSGGVAAVDVPAGHYLVDVYTYLHSMNGRVIVGDVWNEQLGAWFRRDHGGRAFPSWVAAELRRAPEDDPGREPLWEKLEASVDAGALVVETDPLDWVTFLVHLQPFDAAAALDEPEEGDWYGAGQGLRRPAAFPLGVAASGVQDPEVRDELAPLLPRAAEVPAVPEPVVPVDVFTAAQDHDLAPVAGGPVPVPLAEVRRGVRIAWFATAQSHPEARVEGVDPRAVHGLFDGLPGVAASMEGGTVRVGWPEWGSRFATLKAFETVPAETWTRLPEGSRLELATCVPEPDGDPTIGLLRLKGEVRGGAWHIAESFPPVAAATLREALELAASDEDPKVLRYRDEGEAARVLAAFQKSWGDVLTHDDPPRLERAEIRFEKEDRSVALLFATEAFRQRHASVWPVEAPDDDDDDDDF